MALFPDPAYPDSFYYVNVARELAAGHGLSVDFIWIFAEVGARIPAVPTLPIPSNAHWLPLASFLQAPFIAVLGPTAVASALPGVLIGSLAAPLTWVIARDAGSRPNAAAAAGVLIAIPGAATVFMAQPETFGIVMPLVAATLWASSRGLRGEHRWFAVAGLLAGVMALARNDGVLLASTLGLIWIADRVRVWRSLRRLPTGQAAERPAIPVTAGLIALGLFLLVIGPWWARQLAVFGSISPTSASGAALWIRDFREWNSIVAEPSLGSFLAQGAGPIVASRLAGLTSALTIFAVLVCSVVLVPFLLVGTVSRRRDPAFQPWLVYTFVVFAGATLLYPVHVPGGTFIHTAIGLAPHAAILSVAGILVLVEWLSARRRTWNRDAASNVFLWGVVALVVGVGVVFGRPVQVAWDAARQPRIALAAELERLGVGDDERILSIDAGGIKYWTGHPGVVTPDDPIEVIEAVARAYSIRWIVIERSDAAMALGPVLAAQRPAWIGPPAFEYPSADGGLPRLALFPVCTMPDDARCGG